MITGQHLLKEKQESYGKTTKYKFQYAVIGSTSPQNCKVFSYDFTFVGNNKLIQLNKYDYYLLS